MFICSLTLTRHDVTVIPSEDCHASEYIAGHDARREYICTFTGSAGCAVVTHDKAILSTDGRYFSQALKELDSNWQLLKQGTQDVPTWQEWAATEAAGGKTVAVDPTLISASAADKLAEKVQRAGGARLRPLEENLVDLVWVAGRPDRPCNPAFTLSSKFAGKGVDEKLSELRRELAKKKSLGLVVSELDEVAWLFNLRGSDIPYNPVFFSYAIVTPDSAVIYIDKEKLDAETLSHFGANGITVKPYGDIFADIKSLSDGQKKTDTGSDSQPGKFVISNKSSWALKLAFG
ncbi:aminopeptidase P family N-terminal domain-containing protein, partial [Candidatus Bathyarchaeota archaeon]|nr:aminopeptidase P family N-terminal domain-containing protein [Candidatus Bathyarchaeota archaeon]